MAIFEFHAKDATGKYVTGEVEAESESEARVKIRAQRLIPVKIAPQGKLGAKDRGRKPKPSELAKVKPKELQVFTRQFSVLIGAGVPIVQSLEAMMGSARSPSLNAILDSVITSVKSGRPLAEAMKPYPQAFDSMYTNLVSAGEEGGVLDTILIRLAEYIEKSVKLKGKVKGAMTYPAVIVFVSVIVISAIMTFVIPSFVGMFAESGQELPGLTVMVINLSDMFVKFWYLIVAVIVGSPIGFLMYYKTEEGRKAVDPILLKIPILGELILKGSIARFSRTLATMLTAGVRIMESIDIAASVSGSTVMEKILSRSKDSIGRGRTISEVFRNEPIIPDMVAQMISVGEATGNLDIMLEKIADFYEDEVDATADALTSIIEPMLMVVLGGVIAVLVVAMYLPIFNLAGAVGG
ncbi:MAG: type II secretion system F family protein [Bdellovibrionales bacterium]|nr:type II secretion system F family protein [Bdellovibrionales bacterium]